MKISKSKKADGTGDDENLADEIAKEARAERKYRKKSDKPDGTARVREKSPLRRKAKPPAEYPLAALGSRLAPVAEALAEVTKAPVEACAQVLLSVVNAAVQGLADVALPHGTGPVSIFTLCVMASGERKSAIFGHAMKGVRAYEAILRPKYESAVKAAAFDKEAVADIPPLPIVSVAESTIDGLLKMLGESRGSIIVATDEGAVFSNGYGMSPRDLMRTCAAYSTLWNATDLMMARATTGHRIVSGKRVAICLMAQHEAIATFLTNEQARAQGLLGRFLFCMPDSKVGTRPYEYPSAEALQILEEFHNRIFNTLEIPLPLVPGSDNVLAPRAITLSEKALDVFVEFHDMVESRIAEGKKLQPIREFAAKAAEHAVRISATLALFHNRKAEVITAARMRDGVQLAEFYLHEALRIACAEGDADLVLAEKTLAWIKRRGDEVVATSTLYRLGPPDLRQAARARKIAGILVDHGYLAPIEGGAMIDGQLREAFRIL